MKDQEKNQKMQEKNHIVLLLKAKAKAVDAQRVLPGKQEEDDHVLNQLFYLRNLG